MRGACASCSRRARWCWLRAATTRSAPGSWLDFKAWLDGFIASDRAFLTDEARHTASAIMFQIPVPALQRPAMRGHNLVILGSLPPRVRDLYGLSWTPARAVGFRAAVAFARATRPLTPRALRVGWNTRFFDDVARSERALIARGRPVPGALA